MPSLYFVYMLASRRNGTRYVSVTNNLGKRVWEHREGIGSEFTRRIDAEINDDFVGSGSVLLFGVMTDGHVTLRIYRTTGRAVSLGVLPPQGAITGIGDCQPIVAPQTKF